MNLIFLGPPGSGKGTQANRLAKAKRLLHLSTGDVLRAAVKDGTTLGRKADGYMSRGELVPDDLMIDLIEERLASGSLNGGFILDGFPRTVPQATSLDEMFRRHSIKLDKAVLLLVSDAEILKRLRIRQEKEGRNDDAVAIIMNRLEVYRRQTRPIEEMYTRQSLLVSVPGEDTEDNVFAALLKVLQ
jgi:adenylate kinase